jgi:hypothetical protein
VEPWAGPRSKIRHFRSGSSLPRSPGNASEWYSPSSPPEDSLQNCADVQGEVSSKAETPQTRDELPRLSEESFSRPFSGVWVDLAVVDEASAETKRSF